jgi:cytochrome c
MEAVLKKSIAVVWAVLILMVVLLTVPALAGTRDDCIAKCKEAGEFIKKQGIDTAVKEIGNKNGQFVWNDGVSYVFLMDMKAKMLAHPHKPELTKPDTLIEATDIDGKAFFADFVKKAKKERDGSSTNGRFPVWRSTSPSTRSSTGYRIRITSWVPGFT